MAVLIDHVPATRPAGTHEFGPVSMPDSATAIIYRLARQTSAHPTYWPAGVFVTTKLLISVDGGATWPPELENAGFTNQDGGIYVRERDGQQAPESMVKAPLPMVPNRRVKAVVTITGGAYVGEVTVEVV